MERQSGDGFREDADAGVDRHYLHDGTLCDGLAGDRAAKEEAIAAPHCAVLRVVPSAKPAG